MTATFYVGDAIQVMGQLPENSVDLVLTSPPFLALRSYLPADHPDKALEGGSQPTPGEFIDWLLDVVEACARVLAPHGSLCFELGDTFSGSGGAGGDYSDNGWRDGQPKFGGSATLSRESAWSLPQATWFAGVIDTEGYIGIRRQESQRDSPSFSATVRITMMDRQVCDRAAEIAGVGNSTEDKRGAYSWSVVGQQARYVLTNIWPYLLIKQRQAMAAIEMQRNIEEKKRRGPYERIQQEDIEYRQMIREYVAGLNGRGEKRGVYVPTWAPPTPPRLHPPTTSHLDGWPQSKSLSLIPESFRWAMVYGRNPFTGRTCDTWRLRNVIRWVRPNPPVGALGDKFRPATSELMVFCKAKDRYFDLDAVREPYAPLTLQKHSMEGGNVNGPKSGEGGDSWNFKRGILTHSGAPPLDWWRIPQVSNLRHPCPHGRYDQHWSGDIAGPLCLGGEFLETADAPPLDWWNIPPGGYPGAHYAVWPPELLIKPIKAMCPEKVCRTCGDPSRRIVNDRNGTNRQPVIAAHIRERRKVTGFTVEEVNGWFGYATGIQHWESDRPDFGRIPNPDDWLILKERLELSDEFDDTVNGGPLAEYVPHGDPSRQNAEDYAQAKMGQNPSAQAMPKGRATKIPKDGGWTDCGHDDWRPGLVLDPFGGSGTTAAVATGHGRDCILIDLDERNYELALDRVGPFILTRGEVAA